MKPDPPACPGNADEEVAALVETLHRTGARLEELTAGEVDSVVDRGGRTLLLRGVQEQLRRVEETKQSAILNALPANIAMLDPLGTLLAVNEAWRDFGQRNALQSPGHGVGTNYLEICEVAGGAGSDGAREAAAGIRSVLDGSRKSYSLEYPCHSASEQRWFLMTVTPLADKQQAGAVVMHINITERKRGEQELQVLGSAIDTMADAVYLVNRNSMQFVHVNDAACRMMGKTRRELMALHPWEILGVSRTELESNYDQLIADGAPAKPLELLRPRPENRDAWVELRRHAQCSAGAWTIVTLVRDITGRKQAEDKITRLNRVYAVLSGVNTAIVRNQTRDDLFREACRIAVSEGGFFLARVIDMDAAGKARIAVSSDPDTRIIQKIVDDYNADPEHCSNFLGLGLRSGQPMISNDVINDLRMPNRAALTADGSYALAVLPFTEEGRVAGVIILRSREAGLFDDAELRLLLEVVANLSFALGHFAKEEKVRRLSRVNAMLSDINGAIVRIRERQPLFDEVCRIALETGGLSFAWVGVVEAPGAQLQLTAFSGRDDGFVQTIRDRLALRGDTPETQSLSARAVSEGRTLVINDVAADEVLRRRSAFANRGIRSVAVFPLQVGSRAVATFALHAEQAGFFDADEMKLLNEVASNIAFALDYMEKEKKVRRLTRVYAVLSGINTLIVRARDRDEMFQESCRVAAEHGAFAMAWIGVVDRVAMKVVPIASAGVEAEFLDLIRDRFSLVEDHPSGNTMSARAVRGRKPVIANDIRKGPPFFFAKERIERGILSIAVLPLLIAGEAVGVLALYANEADFFDEDEMRLLTELAGDIAFAIDHIGKRDRLDYLAFYDELTGLANRNLFLERLAQYMRAAVNNGKKLALFVFDLERFRNINESLGRTAGDALLRQVSDYISEALGNANLLARLGGDQFAIVLPEISATGNVTHLLEKKIKTFVDHTFLLNDAGMRISAKVGVALFPTDGTDATSLLRNAEAALRKAKSRGEPYLFYQSKMNQAVAGKLSLENQLREALDKEQFVLHYQPKLRLEGGQLTGAEALIRWNDPRTGLVPPGRFIPALEETGLIQDVGRWALRKSIAEFLRWRAAGLPALRIAVNVSPLQLRNRGFVEEIRRIVGIDPHAAEGLELEITESLIMEDVENSIASLQAIRGMGVTIAIDDFGTGFSSLSYLARLPVDTLKIDRSFVNAMAINAEGLSLVSTIINLAHSLRLKVVAEGVETEEQSRLLRLMRCDEMQGFLFSKPVPADIFEAKFLAPPKA